ncbi:MAG: GNAT family N-acetyltransferase [Alicyclobacillus sp.]|nr:GNAT family N-acetyltransferase [Alicyclobacillus sp.]
MTSPNIPVHRATPDRVAALGEMADAVFRPHQPPGQGMPREFPHLFSAENATNLYYVESAGTPVSMVGVLPQQMVLPGVTLDVASIGSVATLPAYERRGISSAILQRVISDAVAAGFPLLLVSGERGLYRRLQCVAVGQMWEAEWTPFDAADRVPIKVEEVPEDERFAFAARLAELYRREPYRFRRTDAEMAVRLNALWTQRKGYDQRLFTCWEGGHLVGYVVAYRENRMPEVVDVMEWAGSRLAVADALPNIQRAFGAARVRLRVHRCDTTMQDRLRQLGVALRSAHVQGTVRLLDVEAFFAQVQPLLEERFGERAAVARHGDVWTVQVGDLRVTTEDVGELTAWVFDAGGGLDLEFPHTDDLNYI